MQPQEIKQKLERVFDKEQSSVLTEVISDAYSDLVKTGDFNELKAIVKDIGKKVGELADAQGRTEARMEELADAQKRTESRVEELAEAQKQTELRVEELAGAQRRTEGQIGGLAEAQRKTEEAVRELALEHKETRKQLGGLSMTVGYGLENEAYKALPKLLKKDHGFVVHGKLYRKFVPVNGMNLEINIIGEGMQNKKKVTIVGEAKSQLSKNDVGNFILKKLKKVEKAYKNIFPVLVTHMISEPDVEEYAREKGIALYYSYNF